MFKVTNHGFDDIDATFTGIYTCWRCETTKSPTWWTYEVDGKTYIACESCAAKTDELALGDEAHRTDHTVCTQIK